MWKLFRLSSYKAVSQFVSLRIGYILITEKQFFGTFDIKKIVLHFNIYGKQLVIYIRNNIIIINFYQININ